MSEMETAAPDVANQLALKSITLFEMTAIRYEAAELSEVMNAEVSLENENGSVSDGKIECKSICSLTVKNKNAEAVALFISHYRPVFEVKTDMGALDVRQGTSTGEALNAVVLHEAFPYHRQLISDMMSRMGLPVFLLPAAVAV